MGLIASQITSLTIVYSTVYSDADHRKHQSSASLAFVRGIHRWPVNSLHKWPVTRKMFPFDDVIMCFSGSLPFPIGRFGVICHYIGMSSILCANYMSQLYVIVLSCACRGRGIKTKRSIKSCKFKNRNTVMWPTSMTANFVHTTSTLTYPPITHQYIMI